MAEGKVPGKGSGWDWFEQAERKVETQRNEDGYERGDMFRLYLNTFSTREGQAVLNDLMRFRRTSLFDPALGFYDGAAQGFYMSGMNDLVSHIERMMATAKRAD